MSVPEFESLLRKQLKLSNCKLRKGRTGKSYDITTLEGDLFWLYWYDFPHVELMFRPVGRPRCGQTTIYERTIRAHINHCISQLQPES
jgi:hypothetical protein